MNSIIIDANHSNSIHDPHVIKHIHEVLKAKTGDRLRLTILGEGLYEATIDSINAEKISIKDLKLALKNEQWVDVLIAAARPQTAKKILEHGTTYGIKNFHFFRAHLTEKSYLSSKVYESEATDHLKLGLAQSARYYKIPSVKLSNFNPAITYKDYDYKFLLDLKGARHFDASDFHDYSIDKKMVIAIGPERGWTKEDLHFFDDAGFTKITISSTVLRVEHALYSTLAVLEFLTKKY